LVVLGDVVHGLVLPILRGVEILSHEFCVELDVLHTEYLFGDRPVRAAVRVRVAQETGGLIAVGQQQVYVLVALPWRGKAVGNRECIGIRAQVPSGSGELISGLRVEELIEHRLTRGSELLKARYRSHVLGSCALLCEENWHHVLSDVEIRIADFQRCESTSDQAVLCLYRVGQV